MPLAWGGRSRDHGARRTRSRRAPGSQVTMGESRQPFAKVPAIRLVGSRLLAGIFLVAVCGAASPAAAAPGLGRPGYTLSKVSAAVPATGIAQLAFRPGDTTHVYTARVSGV